MKTAIEIIETIHSAGADSKEEILDVLEDGERLKFIGIYDEDQESVEQAYDMVKNSDIDAHLDHGGTIGNYQW